MVVAGMGYEKARIRREDCPAVKHDAYFTHWKILVAHSDWQDHLCGKEGATRYRLHHLPKNHFGPGVYELGIIKPCVLACTRNSRRRLRKKDVTVVYIGQADNIRQRLQSYGQGGSHLEGCIPAMEKWLTQLLIPMPGQAAADEKQVITTTGMALRQGPRLFSEAFSRGYSIVFRWAATDSKESAGKIEAQLLDAFDYAWNKGGNGARRSLDILTKLEMQTRSNVVVTQRNWIGFGKRRIGISVALKKPVEETKSQFKSIMEMLRRFIGLSSKDEKEISSESITCGVELDHGKICTVTPLKGRKRCAAHKGLRRRSSIQTSAATKHSVSYPQFRLPSRLVSGIKSEKTKQDLTDSSLSPICGVVSKDGFRCSTPPKKGRKRCDNHKGMRITKKVVAVF